MATYFVTGVSRGIGYEFLRQLSSNPANTVIGLVRNGPATEEKISKDFPRKNIHILQGDLQDYESLQKAAEKTAEITGGSLEVLIANAADLVGLAGIPTMSNMGKTPKLFEEQLIEAYKTNTIGNIHLINLFLPLILKGKQKKVIHLATGLSDDEVTREFDFDWGPAYSISKSSANTAIAKFSAEFKKDGVLFLNLSPGMVDAGAMDMSDPEVQRQVNHMVTQLMKYEPNFKGPITPEESVKAMLATIERVSLANGDGGAFVSHMYDKRWI